ncbi:MAG: YesL family protein [Lachnospiraceae bacterium]|nr:YesL family protein [Lachnospiraceae bacterium]
MGRFFNLDSPFVSFMNRVADLMILNIIYLLVCIPVITIGPATTALYYVTLKMARNEESYIVRSFFRSFKLNFVQGLVMWILDLLFAGIMTLDFMVMNGKIAGVGNPDSTMFSVVRVILMVLSIFALFTISFSFPVLAKFDNTIKNTYRNSFLMSCRHFPTTLVIILVWGAVIFTGYFFPQLLIVHFLILFSLAAFVPSFLLVKVFDKYIPAEEDTASGSLETGETDGSMPDVSGTEETDADLPDTSETASLK